MRKKRKPARAAEPAAEAVALADFELLARERLPHMVWEYIAGGAGDENTARWNLEAFERIRVLPRVLVDVSRINTNVELFGQRLPHPIVLAPTAYQRLVHSEGEMATARGAGAAGAVFVVSTLATTAIEEIAAAARMPLWFQLYVQPDRGFTRELVARAEAAGCGALCVTVDTPVVGVRNRETRAKFALPQGLGHPNLEGLKAAAQTPGHRPSENEIYSTLFASDLTWKDVEWFLSFAKIPVLLKGILHPADAEQAVKTGVAGLIVSNHGGRNLDAVPATAEALPRVTEKVAGRVPVLVDGGIRHGTDVLKALALGASAVMVGRPYLYGLAVAGAEGVARVVNILRSELEMAMALAGRPTIASIDRSALWPDERKR